jgi:hypothetical protein
MMAHFPQFVAALVPVAPAVGVTAMRKSSSHLLAAATSSDG